MKVTINQFQLAQVVEKGLEKTGSFILLSEKSGVHPNTLRKWHESKQAPRLGSFLKFKKLVEEL